MGPLLDLMNFINMFLAVFLSLSALLIQPKKDFNKELSWRNLNRKGIAVCMIILTVGILNVFASLSQKVEQHQKELARMHKNAAVEKLSDTNAKLVSLLVQHGVKLKEEAIIE